MTRRLCVRIAQLKHIHRRAVEAGTSRSGAVCGSAIEIIRQNLNDIGVARQDGKPRRSCCRGFGFCVSELRGLLRESAFGRGPHVGERGNDLETF